MPSPLNPNEPELVRKVTVGFVIQCYDINRKCWHSQHFVASEDEIWEDELGEPLENEPEITDLPINLVQPEDMGRNF